MNNERVISLRELLHYVLKKWRAIIVIAVVLAILAGAYKVASISGAGNNAQANEEEITDKMLLTAQLNDLKEDLEKQTEYNQNSLYMKIDPNNEYVANFNVFISVDDSELSPEQASAQMSKTVMAYYAYLNSNEFYNYLRENVEAYNAVGDKTQYIKELVSVSTELTAGQLKFNCIGNSEELVQSTIDAARQAIKDKLGDIKALAGEHKCEFAFDSVYTASSTTVQKTQSDYIATVDNYKKAIDELSAELDGMKSTGQSSSPSRTQIMVRAIKFAVIGGVAGLVLAAVFYTVCGVISHKMYGVCSWQGCGIHVLGEVYTEKKHRFGAKLDRWIDKIMGFAVKEELIEKSGALAAANIAASLNESDVKSVAVISAESKELCSAVVAGMNTASPNTFSFAGDILTEPEAVHALAGSKEIIILADGEKITVDEVGMIVERLGVWGKKLLGAILIK